MKFCKDCCHFIDLQSSFSCSSPSSCGNIEIAGINLVYGRAKYASASEMRDDETKYGAAAKGWAPKPPRRSWFTFLRGGLV